MSFVCFQILLCVEPFRKACKSYSVVTRFAWGFESVCFVSRSRNTSPLGLAALQSCTWGGSGPPLLLKGVGAGVAVVLCPRAAWLLLLLGGLCVYLRLRRFGERSACAQFRGGRKQEGGLVGRGERRKEGREGGKGGKQRRAEGQEGEWEGDIWTPTTVTHGPSTTIAGKA